MSAGDFSKVSLGLMVKLGSIAVHTAELLSADGHEFDKAALDTLLADPEVVDWLALMDAQAYLPKRRNVPPITEKKKQKRARP